MFFGVYEITTLQGRRERRSFKEVFASMKTLVEFETWLDGHSATLSADPQNMQVDLIDVDFIVRP